MGPEVGLPMNRADRIAGPIDSEKVNFARGDCIAIAALGRYGSCRVQCSKAKNQGESHCNDCQLE